MASKANLLPKKTHNPNGTIYTLRWHETSGWIVRSGARPAVIHIRIFGLYLNHMKSPSATVLVPL